ncbi:MAG: hypothetical protein R3Y49_07380 [Rikenellaceae bacterium]
MLERITIKPLYLVLGAVVVFSLFYFLVFRKLVRLNKERISKLKKRNLAHVMTLRSYFLVLFMITMGYSLRNFANIELYLTPFYFGLSFALLLSALTLLKR